MITRARSTSPASPRVSTTASGGARRDAQVVEPPRLPAEVVLGLLDRGRQRGGAVALRDEPEPVGEGRPILVRPVLVERPVPHELPAGVEGERPEPVVVERVQRRPDDPVLREKAVERQPEQPRQELAPGQVAGAAEEDDDVRVGRPERTRSAGRRRRGRRRPRPGARSRRPLVHDVIVRTVCFLNVAAGRALGEPALRAVVRPTGWWTLSDQAPSDQVLSGQVLSGQVLSGQVPSDRAMAAIARSSWCADGRRCKLAPWTRAPAVAGSTWHSPSMTSTRRSPTTRSGSARLRPSSSAAGTRCGGRRRSTSPSPSPSPTPGPNRARRRPDGSATSASRTTTRWSAPRTVDVNGIEWEGFSLAHQDAEITRVYGSPTTSREPS